MRASFRPVIAGVAAIALLAGLVSCGDVVRQGKSPVFVVVDSSGRFGRRARRDGRLSVVRRPDARRTAIDGETVRVPVIFNDVAQATMRLIAKDAGNGTDQSGSDAVECRHHQPLSDHLHQGRRAEHARGRRAVSCRRRGDRDALADADRCAVRDRPSSAEARQPLRSLANFGGRLFISTIAEITFYGADQVGNDVQVKATMNVSFSDYADPD